MHGLEMWSGLETWSVRPGELPDVQAGGGVLN
jgi:hypothetical protein